MPELVKLKTKPGSRDEILAKLERLKTYAEEHGCVGMACVLLMPDNSNFISTEGRGNRLQLLGIVADLQYKLCADGDDV